MWLPAAQLAGAQPGPALEGARKGSRIGKAQPIGNVLHRKALVADEAEREALTKPVEQYSKGQALGLQPPIQGLAAEAELPGDLLDPHRTYGEKRFDMTFDHERDWPVRR